jgi:hypothetical protein
MPEEKIKTTAPGTKDGFHQIKFGTALFAKPVAETVVMPEPDFDQKKHLYSDKPLRFQNRSAVVDLEEIEDQIDLKNALDSLQEPGSISLDEFKDELGI